MIFPLLTFMKLILFQHTDVLYGNSDIVFFFFSRKPVSVVNLLFIFLFVQGSSKRQILTLAARTLAGQFRDRLKASADSLLENALVM